MESLDLLSYYSSNESCSHVIVELFSAFDSVRTGYILAHLQFQWKVFWTLLEDTHENELHFTRKLRINKAAVICMEQPGEVRGEKKDNLSSSTRLNEPLTLATQ